MRNFNKPFEFNNSAFNITLYSLQYLRVMSKSLVRSKNQTKIDTKDIEKILTKILNMQNSGKELKLFKNLSNFGKLRKVFSENELSNFLKRII